MLSKIIPLVPLAHLFRVSLQLFNLVGDLMDRHQLLELEEQSLEVQSRIARGSITKMPGKNALADSLNRFLQTLHGKTWKCIPERSLLGRRT